MQRRDFLRGSVTAAAAFALHHSRLWAQSSDAHVEILVNEPVGTISPNIYGHFTEHIGGVIYDGVWVGPDSKIPNKYGIRTALLDRLKEIGTPIIRWPGGCFADSYDWKDGIGPAASRPKRTNFWEVDPDAARLQITRLDFSTIEHIHLQDFRVHRARLRCGRRPDHSSKSPQSPGVLRATGNKGKVRYIFRVAFSL